MSIKKYTTQGSNQRNSNDMKEYIKNRTWKNHKYEIFGILGIFISLFSYAIINYIHSPNIIHHIDPKDYSMLKDIFQSGIPWVVLCNENINEPLPEIFSDASKNIFSKGPILSNNFNKVNIGILDCNYKLPTSNKTIYNKFKLNKKIKPVIFSVANGEKPKQIKSNYLVNGKLLYQKIHEQTKKRILNIENNEQLYHYCNLNILNKKKKISNNRLCIVILRGNPFLKNEKKWIAHLMNNFRKTNFFYIDSTNKQLNINNESIRIPKYIQGQHRLIIFRQSNTSSHENNGVHNNIKKNEIKNYVLLYKSSAFNYESLNNYILRLENMNDKENDPFIILDKNPTISPRIFSSSTDSKKSYEKTKSKKDPMNLEKKVDDDHIKKSKMEKEQQDYFPQSVDDSDIIKEDPMYMNDVEVVRLYDEE